MIDIGTVVRINLPSLLEHGAAGTVVAIDCGYFVVALRRVQPPFRGLYEAGELVMVEERPG